MRTENRQRTHREQTENSKPEATLIPVDSRGERANIKGRLVTRGFQEQEGPQSDSPTIGY